MKRFGLSILATIAMAGLLGVAGQAAGASPSTKVGPSITSTVGRYLIRGVGKGPNFSLASCSSDATVACQVNTGLKPRNAAQLWCLSPTTNASVTATYNPKGNRASIAPSTLTVKCKDPHVITMTTPNAVSFPAITGNGTPSFQVTACSTSLTGTSCTYSGETVTISCQLNVYVYTLPANGTATVTLGDGPSVIDGQTITYPFQCRA